MFRLIVALAAIGCFAAATEAGNPLAGNAPSFAGKYSDGRLTLALSASGDGYTGSLTLSGAAYPAKATADGQNLKGSFSASGTEYPFTATLTGNTLTLISADTTYTLAKAVAANPLAAPAPVNPLAQPSHADAPAAPSNSAAADTGPVEKIGPFNILGSTAAGKTLFLKLPDANTLEMAITRTGDELGKLFDAKPTLSGGFADGQTKRRGGAGFTATLKSKPIRGWIFCGVSDQGATASVIYAPADVSQDDIATLFAALPAQAQVQEHRFPDGSGSVELPVGWTTPTQSLGTPLVVNGPKGQLLFTGLTLSISTPDGQLMQIANRTYQMRLQNYQRMLNMQRQFGGAPPPQPGPPPDPDRDFPQLIFCRYLSDPLDAMKELVPIINEKSRRAGKPWEKVDQIIESIPADPTPGIANAHAVKVYFSLTRTTGQEVTHHRSIARVETYPILDGKSTWGVDLNQMIAPDASFDRDVPVMNQIMGSVKVDPDWFAAKIKRDGEAIRQRGEEFSQQLLQQSKDFNSRQAEHFNRFEANIHAQEQARHDSASDFIEMIRGTRDVYDSATGQTHAVDYYNVNGIVNGLNSAANDPNRFVQIPLRYER